MTTEISLREVQESDLPIFFEQQLDPEAARMAAFPARDRDAFMAHWRKGVVILCATQGPSKQTQVAVSIRLSPSS